MKKVLINYSIILQLFMMVCIGGCGVKANPIILKNVSKKAGIQYSFVANPYVDTGLNKKPFYFKDSKNNYILKKEVKSALQNINKLII